MQGFRCWIKLVRRSRGCRGIDRIRWCFRRGGTLGETSRSPQTHTNYLKNRSKSSRSTNPASPTKQFSRERNKLPWKSRRHKVWGNSTRTRGMTLWRRKSRCTCPSPILSATADVIPSSHQKHISRVMKIRNKTHITRVIKAKLCNGILRGWRRRALSVCRVFRNLGINSPRSWGVLFRIWRSIWKFKRKKISIMQKSKVRKLASTSLSTWPVTQETILNEFQSRWSTWRKRTFTRSNVAIRSHFRRNLETMKKRGNPSKLIP